MADRRLACQKKPVNFTMNKSLAADQRNACQFCDNFGVKIHFESGGFERVKVVKFQTKCSKLDFKNTSRIILHYL